MFHQFIALQTEQELSTWHCSTRIAKRWG